MSTQKQPVHQERIGQITASIWENVNGDGRPFFNVTFSKIYRKDNSWQRSNSFNRNDLLRLAKLADLADSWIFKHIQEQRAEQSYQESEAEEVPF
jgi:hypothetical protein